MQGAKAKGPSTTFLRWGFSSVKRRAWMWMHRARPGLSKFLPPIFSITSHPASHHQFSKAFVLERVGGGLLKLPFPHPREYQLKTTERIGGGGRLEVVINEAKQSEK
jgi:hypothetical protein